MNKGFSRIQSSIRKLLREIEERRFRFKVTLEGMLLIVIMLAIGLSALNTGTQLLFLLFSMMCALMMLSAIMAASSMADLKIERKMPREVSMLEPVRIRFRIKNLKRRWTSFSLRIVDFLEDLSPVGAAFVARIDPGKTETAEYRCVFPSRGLHSFRRVHLISRYPFGWIKRATSRPLVGEILVLPAVMPLNLSTEEASVDAGDMSSHQKGSGAGLYGIRKYQQGESIRDIHWKVTAKSGNLMVREYESDERRKATVLLDNRLEGSDDHTLDKFELAIVVAASMVNELINRNYQVELVTASGSVGFDERPMQVKRCQRALARLASESLSIHPPAPTDKESEVYQVTRDESEPALPNASVLIPANRYRDQLLGLIESSERSPNAPRMTMESLVEQGQK